MDNGCLQSFTNKSTKEQHEMYCGHNPEKLADRQIDGLRCNHCDSFALPIPDQYREFYMEEIEKVDDEDDDDDDDDEELDTWMRRGIVDVDVLAADGYDGQMMQSMMEVHYQQNQHDHKGNNLFQCEFPLCEKSFYSHTAYFGHLKECPNRHIWQCESWSDGSDRRILGNIGSPGQGQ
jgi:hypothetical protein